MHVYVISVTYTDAELDETTWVDNVFYELSDAQEREGKLIDAGFHVTRNRMEVK